METAANKALKDKTSDPWEAGADKALKGGTATLDPWQAEADKAISVQADELMQSAIPKDELPPVPPQGYYGPELADPAGRLL